MKTIKGPAIFLAQFMDDNPPFNSLGSACAWMKNSGYKGVQLPGWDQRCFDLEKLAISKDYATEISGIVRENGLEITELSAHLQGQLVAVNPAYDQLFDGFAPAELHGNSLARTAWAKKQLENTIKASANLGLDRIAAFSGALLWPFVYPWPQRPEGLVQQGFEELGKRWKPILDFADSYGIDICFELHPGEDLHDGISFERFLDAVDQHPRANILYDPSHMVLQCMDYLEFISIYHQRIRMFHVKDAEFRPSGKAGVYGSYSPWLERPGRFRSLGDGQVDFKRVFSLLAQFDFDGWAVVEWECALKDSQTGAREGAEFVLKHIIPASEKAFDDFAGGNQLDQVSINKRILGI
jgi:sugar phosphate isomerase/epimerase